MALMEYRWAPGHGVALANLAHVDDDLYPYTRPRRTGVVGTPVDPFPVETRLGSGRVRGDGQVDVTWTLVLPNTALSYIYTRFGLTTAKSAAATIYTRHHDLGTFGRYNCYIVRPGPTSGRLEYLRAGILRVRFLFTDLEAL